MFNNMLFLLDVRPRKLKQPDRIRLTYDRGVPPQKSILYCRWLHEEIIRGHYERAHTCVLHKIPGKMAGERC